MREKKKKQTYPGIYEDSVGKTGQDIKWRLRREKILKSSEQSKIKCAEMMEPLSFGSISLRRDVRLRVMTKDVRGARTTGRRMVFFFP